MPTGRQPILWVTVYDGGLHLQACPTGLDEFITTVCCLTDDLMKERLQALLRHLTHFDPMISVARGFPVFVGVCIFLLLAGCASQEQGERSSAQKNLFKLLPPERTRIDFSNTLSERPTPHRNELLYEYFSNGGGVAAGDLNGDSLDDVYFTGNMTYNRLYLNKGNMVFDDITDASGVAGRKNTWKTGVTMADVNGDGLLDIYVCYSGDLPLERRVDELFINQGNDRNGIPHFEEQASQYGLANPHSSNQAHAFYTQTLLTRKFPVFHRHPVWSKNSSSLAISEERENLTLTN